MDYDKTNMPQAYDAGRGYSRAQLGRWLRIISGAVSEDPLAVIGDVGCGTGRYSGALAEHFQARVIGLDPSEKMLAEARHKPADQVAYVRAPAEALPLARESVDMVFISMVFHHFDDPANAVHECRRVLRPGAAICLRAGTTEQIDRYAYVPFFPETRAILRSVLQPRDFIESTFAAGGFELSRHELVGSEAALNWNNYAERLAHRADSILQQLSDREFERGLQALRNHATAVATDEPVSEPIDFFVFRAS